MERSTWRFVFPTMVAIGLTASCGDGGDPAAPTGIDGPRLLADLQTLAADSMEGRYVGSAGGAKARGHILARLRGAGVECFTATCTAAFAARRNDADVEGVNVIGRVTGTEHPDRYIAVTAHYDHLGVRDGEVFNGADDNASGTAALLALADYFAAHPPRNSILFAAVDGEEGGLTGSRALVADPPVPLEAIVVNVNMDMVSHADSALHVAGTHHYPFLRPYVERVAAGAAVNLPFGHDRPELGSDDWTGASDHAPFHEAGIPFLYFGVEDHPDYHRASDEFPSINSTFYVNAVNAILAVVRELDADLDPIHRTAPTPAPASR